MPTINCVRCRKQLGPYFELARKNSDGSTISSVSICSLICLTQYAYEQATLAGFKLVVGAQGLVAQVRGWLKGGG